MHVDWVWILIILLRGVVNWWMQTSQTSSSLASREMNFWVLLFDQVIVILLSIVNVANKFLEDKEWFKCGVVMTLSHSLFLVLCSWYLELTSKHKHQEKQEKVKNCQDLWNTRIKNKTKIQEALEDLQMGGILFPSSEAI